MHGFFSVFVVGNQNVIKLKIIINEAGLVNPFKNINESDAKLVNSFEREGHVELVKVRLQISSIFRHHKIRQKLFAVFNTLCY
jgi:hypothetical protein